MPDYALRADRQMPRPPPAVPNPLPDKNPFPAFAGNLQAIENIPQFPRRDIYGNIIAREVSHAQNHPRI